MLQDFLAGRNSVASDASSKAATQSDFRPLFATGTLASVNVKKGAAPVETAAGPSTMEVPEVELIQEHGKQRIIITCTCCQRIELECEY